MSVPGHDTLLSLLRQNLRELLVLIFLGGLLGAGTVYFYTGELTEAPIPEEQGTLVLTEILIHDFQDASPRWQLRGKRAVVLEDSQRMRIEGVTIEVFQAGTEPMQTPVVDLEVSAEQGLVEWRSNRITLQGKVVVQQVQGPVVLTETAVYDITNEFLNLPKPVQVQYEGSLLTGDSLTYSRPQNLVSIKQPVTSVR